MINQLVDEIISFLTGCYTSILPILYELIAFYLCRVTATPMSIFEIVRMTLGVGIFVGATGINVAHELGHRPRLFEQGISKALLLTAM